MQNKWRLPARVGMCIKSRVKRAFPTGLSVCFRLSEFRIAGLLKFLATSAMNGIGDDRTDCKVLNHLFTRSSSSYLSRK